MSFKFLKFGNNYDLVTRGITRIQQDNRFLLECLLKEKNFKVDLLIYNMINNPDDVTLNFEKSIKEYD